MRDTKLDTQIDRNEPVIFHVALQPDLIAANESGEYVADSLKTEGFIHCCLPDQLPGVLERYFVGVQGYTVVSIDVEKLPESLKPVYENTVGGTELFPHIYGALPISVFTPLDKSV